MPQTTALPSSGFKYRAFLSYAHADQKTGKRLHAYLERFRIDRDLAGRETSRGPIPTTLRPIFRDREDFSGGSTLDDATIAALDGSAALIVLCSAVSATRPAVNEEVRLFRHRHPARPVIPVMIGGDYPDNYPPALRFEIAGDGAITQRPVTILGPDLREEADGRALGIAKIVAGLLGVDTDEIARRAERERQRRLRNWVATLSAIVVLMGCLTVWALINRQEAVRQQEIAEQRRKEAERNFRAAKTGADALVFDMARALQNAEGIKKETLRIILDRAARIFDVIVSETGSDKELLRSQAAMYSEMARTYGSQGDGVKQYEATVKAQAIGQRLAELSGGGAARVEQSFSQALGGFSLFDQGNILKSVEHFEEARAILERLVASEPENSAYAYELAVVQMAGAIAFSVTSGASRDMVAKRFTDTLALAEQFLEKSKGDVRFLFVASVAKLNLGFVELEKGQLAEALSHFRAALQLMEQSKKAGVLSTLHLDNESRVREAIAGVLEQQGDAEGALENYRASAVIRERLAKTDPGNANWQEYAATSHMKMGGVLEGEGNLSEALDSYTAASVIRKKLVDLDPRNATRQRNLSFAYSNIGDIHQKLGDVAAALQYYELDLAISEKLAGADPENLVWQADYAGSLANIGSMLLTQERFDEAIERFRVRLRITQRLAKSDPESAQRQRSLSMSYFSLGRAYEVQDRPAEALPYYEADLAITERLALLDRSNVEYQEDLKASRQAVSRIRERLGKR